MSIIGAPAVGSFSAPTSQVANGGSATYTLNTRVNNAEELEVFVNNVQQEPTVAYSVASDGVSLTFTETTPSGTGTVYFVFRGLAQQHGTDTGAPRLDGNNSYTGNQTITGDETISGDLTVGDTFLVDESADKVSINNSNHYRTLTMYGSGESAIQYQNSTTGGASNTVGMYSGLYQNDFYHQLYANGKQFFYTNNTLAMTVEASGAVTKPKQTGFMIGLSGGHVTTTGVVPFNNAYFNTGGHFNTSTGVFTAPVTGVYQFNAIMLLQVNMAVGYYYWSYTYNGSALSYCYEYMPTANFHRQYQLSICYKMNANDTMSVYNHTGHWYGTATQHSQFSGYLLG